MGVLKSAKFPEQFCTAGAGRGLSDMYRDGQRATDSRGHATLPDIAQEVAVHLRYPVRFTRGILSPDNTVLRDATCASRRARLLVAIDDGVVQARPAIVGDTRAYCWAHSDRLELAAPPIVVRGGEAIKNERGAVEGIRAAIDAHGIDRHAYVVAIGGGAALDAVGYAAATAHRGVRLVRLPSTVLAQHDSGVGVKNGINAFGKKNFVGTFAAPHAVLNDLELLTSLSDRDWRSGIAEAVKVALLKSKRFFCWIEENSGALAERSLDAMGHLVHRSAELHLEHIATSDDPFELGSARPLDFGHWAAHRLERLTDYELRHGEAVAVGLALDATYAHLSGALAAEDRKRVVAVLQAVGLPVWHPAMAAPGRGGRPALLDGLEEFRQHLGGELTITLIDRIGSGFEAHEIDEGLMLEASEMQRRHSTEGGQGRWEPMHALAH